MEHGVTRLTVSLPGPLDVAASLAPLGRWGDDGIDRWDGARLLRVTRLDGTLLAYRAQPGGELHEPKLLVSVGDLLGVPAAPDLETAVRGTFVSANRALTELAQRDPQVHGLISGYPGIVPVLVPDPFSALVRSISAQQVNLRWAAEIRSRIARTYGLQHEVDGEVVYSLDPVPLARASEADLRALQLTGAKARSVIACARAAEEGSLAVAELARLADEELIERLTMLPGIGRWSAEWFLARTLGRPRVVAGDLGVRKAIGRLYRTAGLPGEAEIRALTAHWGAAAAVAQALALHDLAERPSPTTRAALRAPRPPAEQSSRRARRGGRPGTPRP